MIRRLVVNLLHILILVIGLIGFRPVGRRAEQQLTNSATAKLGENELAIDDATGRAAADIYIARPQIERLGIVAER
jgi:hypothetical protein